MSSPGYEDTPSSLFLRLKEPVGGEGVDIGAEEGAVVPDDAEGTRRLVVRRGVEMPDPNDPSETSGIVPID